MNFAELERNQGQILTTLRAPDSPHNETLTALVTTSCMLELAKLTMACLDVARFVTAAVEVLTQFAPVDDCSLFVQPHDLPSAHAEAGLFDDSLASALLDAVRAGASATVGGVHGIPILMGGSAAGVLGTGDVPEPVTRALLLEQAASQISAGVSMVAETERMRRRMAAATAMELIAGTGDTYNEEHLHRITEALAHLPNIAGVTMQMDNARFPGPLTVAAGRVDGEPDAHAMKVDGRAQLVVNLYWASEPADDDRTRVGELLTGLHTALTRVEQNVRLLEEVETDALTGVGNRRRASRSLAAARLRAERKNEKITVMMCDLDHFKLVNDRLGHDAGDNVLIEFAKMLADTVRGYDTVARWGGEEFVIVCPDTDIVGATSLATRILERTPICTAHVLPPDWSQTVSIGVAIFPDHGDNPDAVVRAADKVLYDSKRLGRNRFTIVGAAPAAHARTTR